MQQFFDVEEAGKNSNEPQDIENTGGQHQDACDCRPPAISCTH